MSFLNSPADALLYLLNSLPAIGLSFLYYLYWKIFLGKHKGMARFFRYSFIAWALNVTYIFFLLIRKLFNDQILSDLNTEFIVLFLNMASALSFLRAARIQLERHHRRMLRSNILNIVTYLCIFVAASCYFHEQLMIFRIVSVLLGSLSLWLIADSFIKYFEESERVYDYRTQWALTIPTKIYAVVQLGYFVPEDIPLAGYTLKIGSLFFVVGMAIKVIHAYGLSRFAEKVFHDYQERSRVFTESKIKGELFDQLVHEFSTPKAELDLRLQQVDEDLSGLPNLGECRDNLLAIRQRLAHVSGLIHGFRDHRFDLEASKNVKEVHNINAILEETIISLKLQRELKIVIQRKYCSQPTVLARRNDLYHVFINLMKNADDVACRGEKSKLVITTQVENTPSGVLEVKVNFADNGPGVPRHIQHKIFKDGFSTKPPDGGSHGHGLYIAKKLIEENLGSLIYMDSPNKRAGGVFLVTMGFSAKE